MATSVPDPSARPRSAAARAGASLTPSPTIATGRPPAWICAMTAALPSGMVPAMTSSMPTAAATARAVASLSPVSRTGCRPSARSRVTAARADGLTVSATATAPRTAPSQPISTAVRPYRSHDNRWSERASGTRMPRSANSCSRPMMTSCPSTVPRAPSPGSALKPSAWGSGPHSARAAALTAAATACSEACSTAPA